MRDARHTRPFYFSEAHKRVGYARLRLPSVCPQHYNFTLESTRFNIKAYNFQVGMSQNLLEGSRFTFQSVLYTLQVNPPTLKKAQLHFDTPPYKALQKSGSVPSQGAFPCVGMGKEKRAGHASLKLHRHCIKRTQIE